MVDALSKLNELMLNGNFAKAEILLFELLKSQPENYNLHKNLGMALLAQKKYKGALECFEKCYFSDKNDFDVVLNLSYLFLKLQDYDTQFIFQMKLLNKSQNFWRFSKSSNMSIRVAEFDEAKKNAKMVIELRGGLQSEEFLIYSDFISLYASILLAKKDIEEFVDFAQKILDTKIFDGDLFGKLLKHDRNKIKPEYVQVVENATKLLDEYKNNVEKNSNVAVAHFCLAEFHHLNDKNLSEDHYVKANEQIASMQRGSLYSRQKLFLNLIDYFDSFNDSDIINTIDPEKGKGLIFVIGMPDLEQP